jgi:hypothetical protein
MVRAKEPSLHGITIVCTNLGGRKLTTFPRVLELVVKGGSAIAVVFRLDGIISFDDLGFHALTSIKADSVFSAFGMLWILVFERINVDFAVVSSPCKYWNNMNSIAKSGTEGGCVRKNGMQKQTFSQSVTRTHTRERERERLTSIATRAFKETIRWTFSRVYAEHALIVTYFCGLVLAGASRPIVFPVKGRGAIAGLLRLERTVTQGDFCSNALAIVETVDIATLVDTPKRDIVVVIEILVVTELALETIL